MELCLFELNWKVHPAMRNTTAIPPSHQVAVILVVKQETIKRIDPIA